MPSCVPNERRSDTMTHKFQLPIGDWSGDGHSQCKWFTVESNKAVEEVLEIHFKGCKEVLDIHSICNNYGDGLVDLAKLPEWARVYFDETRLVKGKAWLRDGDDDMARLWLEMLRRTDPTLEVTIVEEDKLPMLPFYGHDEKGRHISFVGYGLSR